MQCGSVRQGDITPHTNLADRGRTGSMAEQVVLGLTCQLQSTADGDATLQPGAYSRSTWCELGQQHRRPPAQRHALTATALELDLQLPYEAALAIGQGVLLTFFRQSNDRFPESFLAPFDTQLIGYIRVSKMA